MAEDREALKARIRALLSRTTTRGCTEAEAMAAFAKAQQLMREHGLTQEAVEIGHVAIPLGRKRRADTDVLCASIAYACRCRAYFETEVQRSVVYLGRLPWPEVAQWMHEVVAGAVARAAREFARSPEAKRRRTAHTRAQAKRAYMLGVIVGLQRNIVQLVGEHDEQGQADLAAAKSALEELGPMRSYRPLSLRAGGARFDDARQAGLRQGAAAQIKWGVGGEAPLAIGHDR